MLCHFETDHMVALSNLDWVEGWSPGRIVLGQKDLSNTHPTPIQKPSKNHPKTIQKPSKTIKTHQKPIKNHQTPSTLLFFSCVFLYFCLALYKNPRLLACGKLAPGQIPLSGWLKSNSGNFSMVSNHIIFPHFPRNLFQASQY